GRYFRSHMQLVSERQARVQSDRSFFSSRYCVLRREGLLPARPSVVFSVQLPDRSVASSKWMNETTGVSDRFAALSGAFDGLVRERRPPALASGRHCSIASASPSPNPVITT